MRHHLRLLAPLSLGALSFALASCGDQPTQPNLPASPPIDAASAPASDTWIPRTPDTVNRVEFATATVPNAAGQSVVYVIGGRIIRQVVGLRLVKAYNVATDTWSRKRDLPLGLSAINSAEVINGKIYVAGGQKEGSGWSTYAVFVYDPARDTWTRLAGMPFRGAYGVGGVIGGKLYVSVPYTDHSDRSHFIRYDPATNKWATLPSPGHAYHMGGVLYDKLYLVGDQTEVYDPATNKWTGKAPIPVVDPAYFTIYGTAVAAQAKLYVFTTYHTLVYAPLSDSWTVRGQVPRLDNHVASRVFVDGRPRIELVGKFTNYQYVP